jgi:hypothetical protein
MLRPVLFVIDDDAGVVHALRDAAAGEGRGKMPDEE